MEANVEFEYATGYRIQQCFSSTILFMHNHISPLLTDARMHSTLSAIPHKKCAYKYTHSTKCVAFCSLLVSKKSSVFVCRWFGLFFASYRYMYVCFFSAFLWRFHHNKIRSCFDSNSEFMANQSSNAANNNKNIIRIPSFGQQQQKIN